MTLLAAFVAGLLAGRFVWLLSRPVFGQPGLQRLNVRNRHVPVGAGIVLPVALVVVEAGRAVSGTVGIGDDGILVEARAVVVFAALGFALLGLFDDLAGGADARGFKGHLGALVRGELTTGGLKLLGGGALALVAVAPLAGGSARRLLVDAALVALAANLGNLFDRAPGRAIKVGLLAAVVLVAATGAASVLAPVAVVVGAAFGLLLDDLHERLMLGDTGANVLGGVLGLGVVLACAPTTRDIALVGVVLLNLLSEFVSFSRVIARVAPLRALDRAGRLPPERADRPPGTPGA